MAMLPKLTVTLLLFVTVTVCGTDVALTGCTPKSGLAGAIARVGINVSFATNASTIPEPPVSVNVVAKAVGETGKSVADDSHVLDALGGAADTKAMPYVWC